MSFGIYLCYSLLVWYRHTLEPKIDAIPYIDEEQLTQISLSELTAVTKGLDITHMYISGYIPQNLHQIAPKLKQLRLNVIPKEDQRMRLVLPLLSSQSVYRKSRGTCQFGSVEHDLVLDL